MPKTLRAQLSPPERQAGFSIVEVMVAAALLLAVAVGVLPLFSSSIINNTRGRDSTAASNAARSRMEEYSQTFFRNQALVLPGSTTELIVGDWFDSGGALAMGDEVWRTGPLGSAAGPVLWQRQVRITQHSFNDLLDDGTLNVPQAGISEDLSLDLKLVGVRVTGNRASGSQIGANADFSMSMIKAY